MFRGLMRMAAIAGAGFLWRKFRNRNSHEATPARSTFAGPRTRHHASFTGSERRVGARDRRFAEVG